MTVRKADKHTAMAIRVLAAITDDDKAPVRERVTAAKILLMYSKEAVVPESENVPTVINVIQYGG